MAHAAVEVSTHETAPSERDLAIFALGPVQLHGPRGETHELDTYETLVWSSGGYTASAPVAWIRF